MPRIPGDDWFDRPMRWAQLTLVENDPAQYDVDFWLSDRDPFGELYAGCRRLGMNVIARTDPHAVHQDVYNAHPDWIMADATGQPRRHWADPDLWVTCPLGAYNFQFMTDVHRELVSRGDAERRGTSARAGCPTAAHDKTQGRGVPLGGGPAFWYSVRKKQ